ncbi:aldehyde dehydrogenase family protein [Hoeflea sp.]|uniref:aldehyde dehydrogenase family protein n=1 Tax=Hoeflea sp. TaxID=1940281 RepID=UPI003B0210C0
MLTSVAHHRERLKVGDHPHFISGKWIAGEGESYEQIHPSTNEVVAVFPEGDAEVVNAAVLSARKAFDEGPWPRMGARERKKILQKFVEAISAEAEDLGYLQTLDNGLPINFSLNTRVSALTASDIFDHYAGWIDKINGETYPQYTDTVNLHYHTYREPVGVVGAILPWNAPMMMFALKVAPALATGCTVVLKPSELSGICVNRLTRIVAESDLPDGVFNLVNGGPATGRAIVEHPGVDKITFTGSRAVGEWIMAEGAKTMKRVTLELGGKSAALIFPDARSVETAAKTVMGLCSTFLSGQVCSTQTRAIVHKSIVDDVLRYAREQVDTVKFGDPFDMATTSAPIISKRQAEKIMNYIRIGQEEGAELVFGGDCPGGDLSEGNWINPTLFAGVDNKMRIAQEEIFGPVLSVISFETEEEAIALANDSIYGLAGGLYTADLSRAFRVAKKMKTGAVGINGYSVMPNSPAGGVKQSGLGREGGWSTIEAFTELKTLMFNLDA